MKKFLVGLTIAVTSMTMVLEATARPLGGKRSIGRQSPAVTRNATPPAPAPTPGVQQPAARAGAPATPAVQPRKKKKSSNTEFPALKKL